MAILYDLEGSLCNQIVIIQSVTLLASELSIWLVFVIFYGSHLEIQDGHHHHTSVFNVTINFLGDNNEGIAAQIVYLSSPCGKY